MAYEMTGTIKLIKEQQSSASGFTWREFVITTEEERFPQDVIFRCTKDRCALLDNFQPGERIQVSFDIRGREYNGKFFVNLEAFRFSSLDAQAPQDTDDVPVADEPPLDDSVMPF